MTPRFATLAASARNGFDAICGWQLRRLKSEVRSPKSEVRKNSEAQNPNLALPEPSRWQSDGRGNNSWTVSQPRSGDSVVSVVAPAPSPAIVVRAPRPQDGRQPRRLPDYGSRGGCPTSERLGHGELRPSSERLRKVEAKPIRAARRPFVQSRFAAAERFGFRTSDFFRTADFGLRISNFQRCNCQS